MPKKVKGGTFAPRPLLYDTRKKGKYFCFNFLGQQLQVVALKFCITFCRTTLVTSGVSKLSDESHYYSRLFSLEKHRLKTVVFVANER